MEEKHNITNWCIKLGISLLEPKYFEDNTQYTIEEFEKLIPRDIQVPLNNQQNSFEQKEINEKIKLNNIINLYYNQKRELDYYKKEVDKGNKDIKELLTQLNKTEFETDNGLIAKMTTQKRESFDEDKLLDIIKNLEINGIKGIGDIIKTKEYVDMDELENQIYLGAINASELQSARITKEVVTLKVSERKDN